MNSNTTAMSPRSPTVAALLSLIVPGLGHLYLGRSVAGLGLIVAHVALGSTATIVVAAGPSSLGAVALVAAPWCLLWLTGAVWSNWMARRVAHGAVAREYQRASLYVLVGLLALPNAMAWTLAVREHVAELFVVPSGSMLPGIAPGSHVLVDKLAYRNGPIQRGDRVVFINPNARHTRYIKRVVGLAGDVIEMQNDELTVNRRKLEYSRNDKHPTAGEQRIENFGAAGYEILLLPQDPNKPLATNMTPLTVPNGHCFLLGDNRHQSEDSRTHGPVPLTDVVGRIKWVF